MPRKNRPKPDWIRNARERKRPTPDLGNPPRPAVPPREWKPVPLGLLVYTGEDGATQFVNAERIARLEPVPATRAGTDECRIVLESGEQLTALDPAELLADRYEALVARQADRQAKIG